MINKQEIIFTVDEKNNPIKPVERQQAHEQGIWHRTTDIAVVNSKQEILCHKRSMLKDTGAGLWDVCFGGHTLAGVESLPAAILELQEESGLTANPEDLIFVGVVTHVNKTGNNKEFRYGYIYRWDGPMSDLHLEKDEIDEVKWVPSDVIKANRDNRDEWSAMPYFDLLMEKLATLKKQ